MNMNIPEWVKPAVWGGLAGAAAIAIVGFNADWVVTTSTATERANIMSKEAVVAALTPVCVAQFKNASETEQATHLAALASESSWKQGDYVGEHGWATMPQSEAPNDGVADACARQLLELAGS